MAFSEDVTSAASSALNQLTQLKTLLLDGFGTNTAAIHLQLPQLTKLTLSKFGSTSVSLDCSQLKTLRLVDLDPLWELSGLPGGIECLLITKLTAGSMPVKEMLPAQKLEHLSELTLHECPGDPSAVWEACVASKLTSLNIDYPWAPLLPSQPPWQGLPCNLEHMSLWHPLDNGIPLVLEQLSSVGDLHVTHVGEGPMHLTRPLDPFLNMAGLEYLGLWGDEHEDEAFSRWTPAALGLLGLAESRAMRMASVPGGRPFRLMY